MPLPTQCYFTRSDKKFGYVRLEICDSFDDPDREPGGGQDLELVPGLDSSVSFASRANLRTEKALATIDSLSAGRRFVPPDASAAPT